MTRRDVGDVIWRLSGFQWLTLVGMFGLLVFGAYGSLEFMVNQWGSSEEYGYAYLIPAIVLFFVWQKKNELLATEYTGGWLGILVVLVGALWIILGELATLHVIVQYAFLLMLIGMVISLIGWRAGRVIGIPLLILFLMVPLPNFLYQNLSSALQLISSEVGVAVIRLFGVSVYLEGNVIDLGTYKLQVVEACSGLRYLFPLFSLSMIAAYIYRVELWKRVLIVASSIPITVLMNSIRIGVIGVLVDNWGVSQAEGFLHWFEGWVIFIACMVILITEMWLLARIGPVKRSLADVFYVDIPDELPEGVARKTRQTPLPFYLSGLVIIVAIALMTTLGGRDEIIPEREGFGSFPSTLGNWQGRTSKLDQIYVDQLKFDDYIIADYTTGTGRPVNLYMAYYGSQKKGESVHSPRSCIPGGGWQITSLKEVTLNGINMNGVPLRVNRVIISKGDVRQVVYYWFQGRSRILTNEYWTKWYLFLDSLLHRRTDGALVRLTVLVQDAEDIANADRALESFAREAAAVLPRYIPG